MYDADKKKGVEKSRDTFAESSKMKGWILQVMMMNLLNYCIANYTHSRLVNENIKGGSRLEMYVAKKKIFFNKYSYVLHVCKDVHCKKRLVIFSSPAGMSLTKFFLGGDNKIIPARKKIANLFLQCTPSKMALFARKVFENDSHT
jgi:hypothetical protein